MRKSILTAAAAVSLLAFSPAIAKNTATASDAVRAPDSSVVSDRVTTTVPVEEHHDFPWGLIGLLGLAGLLPRKREEVIVPRDTCVQPGDDRVNRNRNL